MNFYLFALFFILLVPINQASPVGHDEDEDMTTTTASTKRPRIEDDMEDVMTTHPTFTGSSQQGSCCRALDVDIVSSEHLFLVFHFFFLVSFLIHKL